MDASLSLTAISANDIAKLIAFDVGKPGISVPVCDMIPPVADVIIINLLISIH